MTLSGANTYTGATTISSGTLLVGAANAISSTSDVTDNATLDLNGFSDTIGALAGSGTVTSSAAGAVTLTVGATNDSGTFSGVIQNGSGVVALTKAGTGTETLSGANTYTGGTTINAGSLTISNGSGLGTGALTVNETTGATFLTVANNNAVTLANNIILAAPGSAQTYTLVKDSASASTGTALSLTGNISGGNANATLYLNSNTTGDDTTSFDFAGNNTFQAAEVDLNRGIIVVGSATGLGNAANLIYLNANDNTTKGDLQFAVGGTFANPIDFAYASGENINPLANTVVLTGNLSGSGAFQVIGSAGGGTGTLVLAGASNTNSGPITIQSGVTLQVGNGGTTGSLGAGAVTDNGTLVYDLSSNVAVSNAISGSGTLTLTSTTGNVSQSAAITVPTLTVSAATGVTLTNAGNTVSSFSAINTTSGNVSLTDAATLTVIGINQAGSGNVAVSSTGTNTALTVTQGVTSSGGSVTLQATGNLTVGADALITSGSGTLTLAADVTAAGLGDDGAGTLSINAGAGAYGANITLRGADENIASTALVGTAASGPQVSTFVSSGSGLSNPNQLTFDSSGNLYIANQAGTTVTKVTPAGAVTTFAGGFNAPSGLAFDASGNLYVANSYTGNATISKVTPGGTVTTFATGLGNPSHLAFDSSGNLYASSYLGNTVYKITPSGSVSIFVTSASRGEQPVRTCVRRERQPLCCQPRDQYHSHGDAGRLGKHLRQQLARTQPTDRPRL